ncbi:MAG: hypothetical protein QXO44_00805 [Thermoplasmatales archaeon]
MLDPLFNIPETVDPAIRGRIASHISYFGTPQAYYQAIMGKLGSGQQLTDPEAARIFLQYYNPAVSTLTPLEQMAIQAYQNILQSQVSPPSIGTYGTQALEALQKALQMPESLEQALQYITQYLSTPIGQSPLFESAARTWESYIRPEIEQQLVRQGYYVPSGAYQETLSRAYSDILLPLLQQEISGRLQMMPQLATIGLQEQQIPLSVASTLSGMEQASQQLQLQAQLADLQRQMSAAQALGGIGESAYNRYLDQLLRSYQMAEAQRQAVQEQINAYYDEINRLRDMLFQLYFGALGFTPKPSITFTQKGDSGWSIGIG